MEISPVFAQTYQHYLEQINQTDFLSKAEMLGVKRDGDCLVVPLYDKVYFISGEGLREENGVEITPAVQVMVCKYILTYSPDAPAIEDKLVTYREFKDSGPLTSYFTTNTNQILETTFAGNVPFLKEKSLAIGGEEQSSDMYDVSLQFYAFPKISVMVNFNDRDDLFPAKCSILYRSTAARYLDMESLAMTGTLLTGKLITS